MTTFFRIFVAIPILIVLGSVAGGTWQNLEILDLMVDGLPTSQVAARLYLAPKTIRNRISEMLGKLGVASREEAIALGRAAGLGSMRDRRATLLGRGPTSSDSSPPSARSEQPSKDNT